MSSFSTLKLPFTSFYTVSLEGNYHHHEQFTLREWGVRSYGPYLYQSGFSREIEQRLCMHVGGGRVGREGERGKGERDSF